MEQEDIQSRRSWKRGKGTGEHENTGSKMILREHEQEEEKRRTENKRTGNKNRSKLSRHYPFN